MKSQPCLSCGKIVHGRRKRCRECAQNKKDEYHRAYNKKWYSALRRKAAMTDDREKRQSIPEPGVKQIQIAHYQGTSGLITYAIIALDNDGRVWRYNELINKWEPL